MRILIVGLGVQGKKRAKYCEKDLVSIVDPQNPMADFKNVEDVPINTFDAAIVCTPNQEKISVINYLLENDKHAMVEKPLWAQSREELVNLSNLLKSKKNLILKTAYNHRYEPSFINMKELIRSNKLGKIYSCRMFYGNGTARLVKESLWKDKGSGVLADLGSHLLDTCLFWFGDIDYNFVKYVSNSYENASPDHVIIASESSSPRIELEMTLCMWRNHFTCDIIGSNGSAHIESLCKWGPSKFIYRERVLPSGKPLETQTVKSMEDPTWQLEYSYFLDLISKEKKCDLAKDVWLFDELTKLETTIVSH